MLTMINLLARRKRTQQPIPSIEERIASLETNMQWVKWIVMVGIPFLAAQLFYVMSSLHAH